MHEWLWSARRGSASLRTRPIEDCPLRGIKERGLSTRPWILFLNPDAEIWQGDLGGFVKVGERRGDVALLGPVIRNPNGTIYESGRAFPGVGQAVGHAFLGPFAPGNRFTRDYRQTSWDRSTDAKWTG